MTATDHRLVCSYNKKAAIKAALIATAAKRKTQVLKVYECKIVEKRLNNLQREQLEMLFLEGKWFYNHVLNLHKSGQKLNTINTTHIKEVRHYNKDKEQIVSKLQVLSAGQKQAILTRMNQNEKTIMTLSKKGIQKNGSLRFKSELNCIPLKQYGMNYKFVSINKVKIQGIKGSILVRTGNQLKDVDEFANANLVKRADGYFLKIVTFTNKSNIKNFSNGKEIGLDFGIKTNIITSEGEKIDVSVEESDRLKKLQKQLFRKVKGSNNRQKTILSLRKAYRKMTNKKQDKVNKIYHKLKAYDRIYMQDEQIANWQKSFGKQVQHSCMGLVKAKLKALPQTVILDKWIPTTQMCPKCYKKNSISLDQRVYFCSCGYHKDRDLHAAKNMIDIAKSCFENSQVPMEHREVTLMEFKASVRNAGSIENKLGR